MLNKNQIKQLIKEKDLISDYINLEKQLTPNGFDLTVGSLYEFTAPGALDFSNSERVIPEGQEILARKRNRDDKYGWWQLSPGAYKVRTNETVTLPNNLVALAFPRTSLLRMGGFVQNGVWDAGFSGKGEFILAVANAGGINIKQNARIVQIVFCGVDETEQYRGIYQGLK
jgi:dUTP pyrophosphatase